MLGLKRALDIYLDDGRTVLATSDPVRQRHLRYRQTIDDRHES